MRIFAAFLFRKYAGRDRDDAFPSVVDVKHPQHAFIAHGVAFEDDVAVALGNNDRFHPFCCQQEILDFTENPFLIEELLIGCVIFPDRGLFGIRCQPYQMAFEVPDRVIDLRDGDFSAFPILLLSFRILFPSGIAKPLLVTTISLQTTLVWANMKLPWHMPRRLWR